MCHTIGLEWNPKFPEPYLIDAEGKPLSLPHNQLCKHPCWKNIRKEGDVTRIPTIYYKCLGRDIDSGIWRVWVSDEPQPGFKEVPGFTIIQIGGHARVGDKANWKLFTAETYLVTCWLYEIEHASTNTTPTLP